jgi:NADH:ubiquinone oxidoreductase subunit
MEWERIRNMPARVIHKGVVRRRDWTPRGIVGIVRSARGRRAAWTKGTALTGLRTNSFFTMLRTWLHGVPVGADVYGNRYYRERGSRPSWRHERRWVVFGGAAEPTTIPPGWVGWLHKRIELPPSEQPLPAPKWEREPLPNLTGTEAAYLPPGALQRGGHRAPATGDYEAWRPD